MRTGVRNLAGTEFDLIQTFRVMRFQRYFKSLQLSGQEFKLNVRQRRGLMYELVEDGRGFAEIRYGSICGHRALLSSRPARIFLPDNMKLGKLSQRRGRLHLWRQQ